MSFANLRSFALVVSIVSFALPKVYSDEIPPLEGPVMRVIVKVTNQRESEDEWQATPHTSLSGSALPGATTNFVSALLDTGSGTHLVSYPDAVALGLQGAFLSGSTFGVSGVDNEPADLDVSMPVGFFVQGFQDLTNGQPQAALMFGQGNFAAGVNSQGNYEFGIDTPTLIGSPFLLYFPAYIRNSEPVQSSGLGDNVLTPSITFYSGASDPQIPVLAHRIYLQAMNQSMVLYLPDVTDDLEFIPQTPSLIFSGFSAGGLFFTASAMTFRQGTNTSSGKVVVDTGATATLISEIAAAELGLNIQNPDFTIEVQGLVDTITAPGFYVDSASIPAGFGPAISWSHVPVVVLNVPSPEGDTLYGILGSNLTARRDMVFNGAASPPYLDITDPIVEHNITITAVRPTGPNSVEVDWNAEPAPPVIYLQTCTNLTAPDWQNVATNSLGTINGTLAASGLGPNSFFRLLAP